MSTGEDFIHSIFSHHKETVAPLANTIMSEISLQLLGHLECQNLSLISDGIGISYLQKNREICWQEEDILFI